jgi:hypothetical protein
MPCEDCRRAGRPEQRAEWRVASPGSNYFDTRPRWCRICARSHPGATAPPKSKPRPRCLGCTKSANYTDTTSGGAKWCVTCARTATIGEPIRVGRPAVKRRWDDAGFELRPEPAGLLREGRFFEPAPHKASKFPANIALAQALRHARGGYPDAERALREAGCVHVRKTHPEDFTAKAGGIKYYKEPIRVGRPAVKRQAVSEDANATDATECAICMSTPVDSVTTPCDHTFCGECLGYWLNQQESGMSCPQCRSGLRSFARKIAFTDTLPAAWCEPVVQDAIEIGTLVEANFGQYGAYYPGRITSVNSNGTYSIDYDDGDKEARVPRHCVRLRPLEAASRSG